MKAKKAKKLLRKTRKLEKMVTKLESKLKATNKLLKATLPKESPDFHDAALCNWSIETNTLPSTLLHSQVVITNTRVYLLGGHIEYAGKISKVYSAPINNDGTLGAWRIESNRLPDILYLSQVVVTDTRVYLLGGHDYNDITDSIYSAPIQQDGTLGKWVVEPNTLPEPLYDSQVITTNSRVYLLGGNNGNGRTNRIYSAPISTDGTLGVWTTESNVLPEVLEASQAVVTSSRVYLLGGWNSIGATNEVYSAPINSDGTLGVWVIEENILPDILSASQAVVTSSRVYLLGGFNGNATNKVYSAPINSDGTLGSWTIEPNRLPEGLYSSQAVVTNNRVYLLGGGTTTGDTNKVYSAPMVPRGYFLI